MNRLSRRLLPIFFLVLLGIGAALRIARIIQNPHIDSGLKVLFAMTVAGAVIFVARQSAKHEFHWPPRWKQLLHPSMLVYMAVCFALAIVVDLPAYQTAAFDAILNSAQARGEEKLRRGDITGASEDIRFALQFGDPNRYRQLEDLAYASHNWPCEKYRDVYAELIAGRVPPVISPATYGIAATREAACLQAEGESEEARRLYIAAARFDTSGTSWPLTYKAMNLANIEHDQSNARWFALEFARMQPAETAKVLRQIPNGYLARTIRGSKAVE